MTMTNLAGGRYGCGPDEAAPAAILLWRAVAAGGIHCKPSTARMVGVKLRIEDAVAPMRARSARLPASASAIEGRLFRAA